MADEKTTVSRGSSARTAAARAAGARTATEQVRETSGVVPVLFSAVAEAHDVAVVVGDQDTGWRSPFGGGLRPASGE
ncbi:hypothetical protein [Amycolatopsis sp. NPDC051372]|uniref:hypothetical protein n=1 Tax=unclassified Amycolatopsis TaxID=2618356 RepID=UPI003446951C